MDESAGEGVLDGHHGRIGHSGPEGLVQVLEGVALDDGGDIVGIEIPGGLLVEAALIALYGDPFHGTIHQKGPSVSGQPNIHLIMTYDDTTSGYYRSW